MPVINPDHLLDQSRALISAAPAGAPRQADLRRAISTAYYAIFHLTVTSVADTLVGNTKRSTASYGLAYRSIDHRWLRDLCSDLAKPTLPTKLAKLLPTGVDSHFGSYAAALVELQEKRHIADYDPLAKMTLIDAKLALQTAESAKTAYLSANEGTKGTYAALLAFGTR